MFPEFFHSLILLCSEKQTKCYWMFCLKLNEDHLFWLKPLGIDKKVYPVQVMHIFVQFSAS